MGSSDRSRRKFAQAALAGVVLPLACVAAFAGWRATRADAPMIVSSTASTATAALAALPPARDPSVPSSMDVRFVDRPVGADEEATTF